MFRIGPVREKRIDKRKKKMKRKPVTSNTHNIPVTFIHKL